MQAPALSSLPTPRISHAPLKKKRKKNQTNKPRRHEFSWRGGQGQKQIEENLSPLPHSSQGLWRIPGFKAEALTNFCRIRGWGDGKGGRSNSLLPRPPQSTRGSGSRFLLHPGFPSSGCPPRGRACRGSGRHPRSRALTLGLTHWPRFSAAAQRPRVPPRAKLPGTTHSSRAGGGAGAGGGGCQPGSRCGLPQRSLTSGWLQDSRLVMGSVMCTRSPTHEHPSKDQCDGCQGRGWLCHLPKAMQRL